MASARAKRAVTSVILARTRSPGSACRTNTTRARPAQAGHAPAAVRGLAREQFGHVPRREQVTGAGRLPRLGLWPASRTGRLPGTGDRQVTGTVHAVRYSDGSHIL